MTKKEFARRIFNLKKDNLQLFLNLLQKKKIKYCVIGGLAVNAYAEPVVSLDLDLIIETKKLAELKDLLPPSFKLKSFPNRLNLSFPDSDLRI